MAFHGYMGASVAITSQEDAAVWMGSFDWEAMEFVGKGRMLHFPRNEHCQKVYCNGKPGNTGVLQWYAGQYRCTARLLLCLKGRCLPGVIHARAPAPNVFARVPPRGVATAWSDLHSTPDLLALLHV